MKEKYNQIIQFLRNCLKKTNALGVVIGISGGKDSTVVAKLLVDAIGKENVLGVMMPNGEQKDIEDSYKICNYLDINYTVVNINDAFNSIVQQVNLSKIQAVYNNEENIPLTEKSFTNVPPRIRMTILYAIAQSMGYLVVGTGNRSEQFIGWFTKWGDGACDVNPIAHLTCTEVIELGDYLDLPYELVHKVPADGLTGKSDEENFGFTYSDLDNVMAGRNSLISEDIYDKIWAMHRSTKHKFSVATLDNYHF